MPPLAVAVLLVAALGAALTAAPRQPRGGPVELVEVDAVVVDGKGRSVKGLRQADFAVRDSGKPVEVSTFAEFSGPVPNDPDSARTVVLLLDDTGVAALGTQTIQIIARAFVSSAAAIDDVPVVRLHAKTDEPFGDRITGEDRIKAYRGGAWPFADWAASGDVLARVRDITQAVASNTAKRKVLVCVGAPFICNLPEPQPSAPRSFEGLWAAALTEAARANVAVYALVPGRAPLRGGGLPELTGGEVFTSGYDVGPPIDRILQDASNYYVLGYWPANVTPDLHAVEVKVNRKGVKVHARRVR